MRKLNLFIVVLFCTMSLSAQEYFLFIGTYTGTGSKGVYVYRFDTKTGKVSWVSNTDSSVSPSFLALAPNGKTLYACNETASPTGGTVSAFRFDDKKGTLNFLNMEATGGNHPCYVSVDRSGRWVLAGNYSGGSVAAFPVKADGSLLPNAQVAQHKGRSITERQTAPHVHAAVFSPEGQGVFVPDLGLDKLVAYRFAPLRKTPLTEAQAETVSTTPGAGPRHLAFHPNGRWAYLIEELSGSVSAFRYQGGKMKAMQRLFTHPDTANGPFGSADIHVSPDGKFLYASNRAAENNVAIFRIDQRNGKLTTVGYVETKGDKPRNFSIDPTGNWLLVANQETNNVVVFRRNSQTGLLTFSGEEFSVPKPVCLLFQKK